MLHQEVINVFSWPVAGNLPTHHGMIAAADDTEKLFLNSVGMYIRAYRLFIIFYIPCKGLPRK